MIASVFFKYTEKNYSLDFLEKRSHLFSPLATLVIYNAPELYGMRLKCLLLPPSTRLPKLSFRCL